jgi:hypothetical protein
LQAELQIWTEYTKGKSPRKSRPNASRERLGPERPDNRDHVIGTPEEPGISGFGNETRELRPTRNVSYDNGSQQTLPKPDLNKGRGEGVRGRPTESSNFVNDLDITPQSARSKESVDLKISQTRPEQAEIPNQDTFMIIRSHDSENNHNKRPATKPSRTTRNKFPPQDSIDVESPIIPPPHARPNKTNPKPNPVDFRRKPNHTSSVDLDAHKFAGNNSLDSFIDLPSPTNLQKGKKKGSNRIKVAYEYPQPLKMDSEVENLEIAQPTFAAQQNPKGQSKKSPTKVPRQSKVHAAQMIQEFEAKNSIREDCSIRERYQRMKALEASQPMDPKRHAPGRACGIDNDEPMKRDSLIDGNDNNHDHGDDTSGLKSESGKKRGGGTGTPLKPIRKMNPGVMAGEHNTVGFAEITRPSVSPNKPKADQRQMKAAEKNPKEDFSNPSNLTGDQTNIPNPTLSKPSSEFHLSAGVECDSSINVFRRVPNSEFQQYLSILSKITEAYLIDPTNLTQDQQQLQETRFYKELINTRLIDQIKQKHKYIDDAMQQQQELIARDAQIESQNSPQVQTSNFYSNQKNEQLESLQDYGLIDASPPTEIIENLIRLQKGEQMKLLFPKFNLSVSDNMSSVLINKDITKEIKLMIEIVFYIINKGPDGHLRKLAAAIEQ